MKKHKFRSIPRAAISLLLTLVMLIGVMPISSIAEFSSSDKEEYLHDTQPGVDVQKAYTICDKHGNNCTNEDHERTEGAGQTEAEDTLGPTDTDAMSCWDLNSGSYQDDYFAVMYKMTISPTKGVSGDNGACGIVIGGEDFACAYIRYDGNNGSQRTTNYELTFGPYWGSKVSPLGSSQTVNLRDYIDNAGNGEVMIIIVGSYANEKKYYDKNQNEWTTEPNSYHKILRLKAYVNGNPVNVWGGGYEAYYDCTNADKGEFNGKIGYATKLHKTYAFARFVTSRTVLDSTAFNEQKSKVDASRPSDIQNIRTYKNRFDWDTAWDEGYAQPKQWKVTLKNFAVSYTFKADDYETNSARGGNFGYGSYDQEVGLTFGSGGKNSGIIIAATYAGTSGHDHDYSQAQRFTGNVRFGPWWTNESCTMAKPWTMSNTYSGLAKGQEHTILVTGTYNSSNNTATIQCYIDGNQASIFGGDTSITLQNFDGYVGWMTHIKDVQAVARFQQWDETESYFSLGADALDYRTRGPVLGYWKREINGNSLKWGLQEDETYDGVTITSTYDHYDHPDANMYQLGQIASTDRDFYMTVTLTNDGQQKGFYLCAEEPRDDLVLSNGEIQVGNSTVGNDPNLMGGNTREWYSKYIAVILDGNGNLIIWNNRGNFGYNPKGKNYQGYNNKLGLGSGEKVRLKVVYKNNKIEIYADKESTLDRYKDPKTLRFTYNLKDTDIHGTTFGLWSKNELDRNAGAPYYSKDIKFENIKVSYGLQAPSGGVEEVLGTATGTTGSTEERNKHLAGFVQTRDATDGSSDKYDLRVIIEGDDYGFRRAENYDAIIAVKFTDSDGNSRFIDGFAHHIAYTEYSFYDAEYYFHAYDGCGMLSLVITNIPKSYENIEVYVVFLEGHTWGDADYIREKVRIGGANYNDIVETPNYGGTPAPNNKDGVGDQWEYKD